MKNNKRAASPDDASQRLVKAAIEQIEEHGLGQVTVRGVAAAAGMNIAAVNYYFRSKEALIAAALEGSVKHLVDDVVEYVARMPSAPEAVLVELFEYLLDGAARFSRLGRAHLHEAFTADDYSGHFFRLFTPMIPRMKDAVKAGVPDLTDETASQRVVSALSSVWFPAFFPGVFPTMNVLSTTATRTAYAKNLAQATLAPANPPQPRTKRR